MYLYHMDEMHFQANRFFKVFFNIIGGIFLFSLTIFHLFQLFQ
ncbi:hypothetical protein HMPREF9094_1117 [Fusobacterium animalis ATCC 51191]|uniref:Uncharacterized protein n=1 Tax=Fusobacterium animalis ATCC 51191 TaxID=997347 RepID=F9EMG2_9FUSO|nr:hypothetical protein HMPREF9094_1117 [Fusobacterium animalis ATCC 51191]